MTVDGRSFPSKAEGNRYITLRERQSRGEISGLTCQPRFRIVHPVTQAPICVYVGDFIYKRSSITVVEDVKGMPTDTYTLKRKLMRVLMGIHVYEVKVKSRRGGVYTWTVDGEEEHS